jgi:hypothetical protein
MLVTIRCTLVKKKVVSIFFSFKFFSISPDFSRAYNNQLDTVTTFFCREMRGARGRDCIRG